MTNEEKANNIATNNLDRCFGNKQIYGATCALEMAAWKQEELIEKACEWLLHNAIGLDDGEFPVYDIDFIEDFKQAMKGE